MADDQPARERGIGVKFFRLVTVVLLLMILLGVLAWFGGYWLADELTPDHTTQTTIPVS